MVMSPFKVKLCFVEPVVVFNFQLSSRVIVDPVFSCEWGQACRLRGDRCIISTERIVIVEKVLFDLRGRLLNHRGLNWIGRCEFL
jgi:hypothetical protein